MPLSLEAYDALADLTKAAGDYALAGVFFNGKTLEMGTFSSRGLPTGAVLAFLQQALETLLQAAMIGELQGVDDGNEARQQRELLPAPGTREAKGTEVPQSAAVGKRAFLVH